MRKRWKILGIGLCAFVAFVSAGAFFLRDKEPSYNGRVLSDWIWQYYLIDGFLFEKPLTPAQVHSAEEARDAVTHIGTNGIPLYLKWGNAWESKVEMAVGKAVDHLPESLQPRWLSIATFKHSTEVKHEFARIGFRLLGTNARPALPELARWFNDSKHDDKIAGEMLSMFGVDGLKVFTASLDSPDRQTRNAAVSWMGHMGKLGTNASFCIPKVIARLDDEDWNVARIAAKTLGELHISADEVVPALARTLQNRKDTDPAMTAIVRRHAIGALARFGEQAKPAIPTLRNALDDADSDVRDRAAMLLKKLDAP